LAYYNKACALSLQFKNTEALSALKKSIQLDNTLVERAKNDTDFKNIKLNPEFMKLLLYSQK
jgi:hypothetical protein